jgi:hypothetical protein
MENAGYLTTSSLAGSDAAKYTLTAVKSQENSVTEVINIS